MRTLFPKILLAIILMAGISYLANSQTTRYAGTYAQLTSAITASASSGDIIQITGNIVVTAQVSISKSLTIYGNGYTITVPNPGLDEMGRFSATASTWRVFSFGSGYTITIYNLTIKGGHVQSNGAAITSSARLILNNCVISNSRAGDSYGGGGINNTGTLFLNNCYLRRNAARYGGGMLNAGAIAYIESTTMVENRTTSTNGGGGAIENNSSGYMYINNSTLSNNQSREVGGAFNNYTGTVYFINSSATGNVVYGSLVATKLGGAIGNNGGTVKVVNSLFAHNYQRTTGTEANPTGYILDDLVAFVSQSAVHMYYSIYHASLPSGFGSDVSNIKYTGNANGSDNTIFSDGILTRITDNDGTEIGDYIFRPFLYDNQGSVAPTLKSGSFILQTANRGTRTRYANNNNVNPVVAYYNGSAYVNLTGTSISGQEVLVDQMNDARPNPPARGAIEGAVDNLYMVKVLVSANGTVSGGTFYGDIYPAGSSVTITAIPNSGYEFTRYDYVLGGTGTASTNNPYTFTVNNDITLQPVFTALPVNNYQITYLGNGNTSGTAPADVTFSGSTTISGAGTLSKTGYTFSGWNTNAYGAGTAYTAGATYSTAANLALYAQWTQQPTWNWTGASSNVWGTVANWTRSDGSTATVPAASDNVNIPNMSNDPVIASGTSGTCNNLTVANGAGFTVASGGSLITNGTVTGEISIERTVSGNVSLTAHNYHLVSVPLVPANNSLSGLFLDSYLFRYIPAGNSWQSIGTSTTIVLDETKGYMIYFPGASHTYTFTGVPNTGTFTPTVSYEGNSGSNNFALVPNPYPSNIDWNAASGWTKTNIGSSIWVYNNGNYAIWDGTNSTNGGSRYIAVGQAFFVQTTAASPALVMGTGVRTNTTATFLKNSNVPENQLRIKATANGMQDEILAGMGSSYSSDYDPEEDAVKLYGAADAPQLYTLIGENKLSINQFSPFASSMAIPMGFQADYTGDVTLNFSQLESFPVGYTLKMEDKITGQLINLRETAEYHFLHKPANFADRFVLHFGSATGLDEKASDNSRSWISGNILYLSTPELSGKDARIEMFNTAGRLVFSKEVNLSTLQQFEVPVRGAVVVRITLPKRVMIKKYLVML